MEDNMLKKTIALCTYLCDFHSIPMKVLTKACSAASIVEKLGYSVYHQSLTVLSYFADRLKKEDYEKVFGSYDKTENILLDLEKFEKEEVAPEDMIKASNSEIIAIILTARILERVRNFHLTKKNYDEAIKFASKTLCCYAPFVSVKYMEGYNLIAKDLENYLMQIINFNRK